MWYIKINGAVMPPPVSNAVTEIDIDSAETGRGESGFLHRERVRHNVASYDLEWQNLNQTEAQMLRNALAPDSLQVEARFLGFRMLRTMYAGDRQWTEQIHKDGSSTIGLNVKLTEI